MEYKQTKLTIVRVWVYQNNCWLTKATMFGYGYTRTISGLACLNLKMARTLSIFHIPKQITQRDVIRFIARCYADHVGSCAAEFNRFVVASSFSSSVISILSIVHLSRLCSDFVLLVTLLSLVPL